MKKPIILTLAILLLIAVTYLMSNFRGRYDTQVPDVEIISLSDSTSLRTFCARSNTLVILYKSTCSFSQSELTEIHEINKSFKGVKLAFLSKESPEKINYYRNKFFPTISHNILFGSITSSDMDMLSENDLAYPYILYYNKKGEVKIHHKGYVKASKIWDAIQKL